MTADGRNDQRALIPYGPKSKTGSPSPDGGSAAPILRGFAFFAARSCVDHLEFILRRGVLALVGNHIDHRPPGALLSPFHQEPYLRPLFSHSGPLGADLLEEKKLYFPGSTKNPPMTG